MQHRKAVVCTQGGRDCYSYQTILIFLTKDNRYNMPQSIRVLHVDDEPDFGDLTATCLEREDDRFAVQTATSAAEALDSIRPQPPDCIVSDYDMPGQSGIEFLERVRDEWPDLPFILFTGKGSEEVASEAISAGVTDYLQKGGGTDQYAVLANRIQNAVERVQAKRQQERQLNAIETAQEGISILDEEGHYLYVNEAFANLHGYDPEEMIGEHWELVYRDEDVPRVQQEILPVVERAGNWHGETISVRADGTTVDVDHTLARTNRGELVCTVRDISEQKEREEQIRQSAARLEALFENSPDMINVHDMDGNIIDPNPRLCEKTGYDTEALAGMKIWELDRNITPGEVQTLWERMDVGDRQRFEGEYQRKDGSTFPVEVHIQRLDLAGEERFMAISRDITERNRTERKRQQIINRMNDAVIEVDPDWQITLVNNRTAEFSGLTDSELLGRNFWAVFADARGTRFEEAYRRAMDTRQEVSIVDYYSGVDEWFDIQVYPNDDGGLAFYFQTITDYKERQRELERTERRYQAILNDPNFLAGILDTDGTLLEVNQTAMEYIDADVDDVVGEPFPETPWWPDHLRSVISEKIEHAASGEYVTYEADLTTPDGDPYSVSGVIRPVTNDDEEVVSLVISARDITERKEREQELERKTKAINQAPIGITLTDPNQDDNPLVFANETFRDLVGYEYEEMQGWNHRVLQGPDTREEPVAEMRRAIDAGESTTVELRNYRQDGTEFWNRVSIAPLRDDEETIMRWVGFQEEITDRKERERELEEITTQYATLIEHFPDGAVFLFDDNLQYIQAGGSELSTVGLSSADIEGATPDDLFPEEIADKTARYYQATLHGEQGTYQQQYQGEHYEIRTIPIRDDKGDVIYGMAVSRNISEEVERKQELERQNERLAEFASVVSHDLRNPLRVADGKLELAQRECDSSHLDDVADALDRSQALIDDLLTLARSGDTVGSREQVSLSVLAEESWKVVPDGEATLTVETSQTISADRSRLRQLLENLLTNAVEHGGEDVTVRVGDLTDGFYVADDGNGIPDGERKEIFEAGYSTAEDGTGFGLRIVKRIVDAHGWDIQVTAGTDDGVRFEITDVDVPE